jgi:2-hydroxychromene-2-carboxylate isomerase
MGAGMGLKSFIRRKIAERVCSLETRARQRRKAERARLAAGDPHIVEYFHEAGDPYSHLMAQILPEFCKRYDISLKVNIVPPPPDWAAPDRKRLNAYSRLDADRLAGRMGWDFTDPGAQPDETRIAQANALLVQANEWGRFNAQASGIGTTLWDGDPLPELKAGDIDQALDKADARRDTLGHYLGGMLYYAGEWYWGPDRLHFLESRLRALGAHRSTAPADLFCAPIDPPTSAAPTAPHHGAKLHWYLSFRSPYMAIVADRVKALADAYGAELVLRPVLPMVMRGMQVPVKKGFYIIKDVAREAERLDLPFGKICDPVGKPIENGYAILMWAMERGRGFEFTQSFLSGVWAEGLNASTTKGLKIITERAGLPWNEVKHQIETEDWRTIVDSNRQEMFDYDIWGVPSFRVEETVTWGQDRLWVIENALIDQAKRAQSSET